MPWWPSRVPISANTNAISVSGFCRPVSTLASLTGVASGRLTKDSWTDAMRSPLSAALRASAPTLAYDTMLDSTAFISELLRSFRLDARGLDDLGPQLDLALHELRVRLRARRRNDEAHRLEL